MPYAKPLVAIVGRPNVGKSTFFNRITGKRISIVDDTPGVTRDRLYGDTEWLGRDFVLIDTGGLDLQSEDALFVLMRRQAEVAIDTADVICFFTDARSGLTPQDHEVAQLLRRSGKPVILVVNKVDHPGLDESLYEYYELGLGDPFGISSANMLGLGDLLDRIISFFPDLGAEEPEDAHIGGLAVIGRPNVGKSSLINRLLGEERVMVSAIPGTTRDAVDTRLCRPDGRTFNIIDTAGIRRKRSIEDRSLERYSVLRSFAAIRRCDVALLMMDAANGVTEQDERIAGMVKEEGKALLLVVNKWDLVEKETGTMERFEQEIRSRLDFVSYAPVHFISALTGRRVDRLWDLVDQVDGEASRKIGSGVLNDVLGDAQISLQAPSDKGRRLKIHYATQCGTRPPAFLLFVNDVKLMHFSYERYLENQLRKAFGFTGTPLRLLLRQKGGGTEP